MNATKEKPSDYFVMQSILDAPPPVQHLKILRAAHLGMCFGVRDAIALALEQASRQPLTILGDLVHNETVVGELRAKGIQIENQLADVKTNAVMISAHGASDKMAQAVRREGPARPRSDVPPRASCASRGAAARGGGLSSGDHRGSAGMSRFAG